MRFYTLVLILFGLSQVTPWCEAQTIDVTMNGRYAGAFQLPTDEAIPSLDFRDFALHDSTSTLSFTFESHASYPLDSLNFFCGVRPSEVTDSIEFSHTIDATLDSTWVVSRETWHGLLGVRFIFPQIDFEDLPSVTLIIEGMNWEDQPPSSMRLGVQTNIPAGSVGWVPFASGNVWQYARRVNKQPEPSVRYGVIDTFTIDTSAYPAYIFVEDAITDSGIVRIHTDTLVVDSLNRYQFVGQGFHWPHSPNKWWFAQNEETVERFADTLRYTIALSADYIVGADVTATWVYGLGQIKMTSEDETSTTYSELEGAQIGSWAYSNFTPLQIVRNPIPSSYTFSAYPNPFNASVLFVLPPVQSPNIVQILIYDIQGRLIHSQSISRGETSTKFRWTPKQFISSGIYFVVLHKKFGKIVGQTKVTYLK